MPDEKLIAESESLTRRVARDFVKGTSRAIVVRAAAGAGKSGLVTETAGAVGKADLRLAIAAPTNAQVMELVRRCSSKFKKLRFTYLHASSVVPEEDLFGIENVTVTSSATTAGHQQIVLATADKFAYSIEDLPGFDRLILDEAFQADSTRYLCIANLAEHHMLVGDSGQLDPFSIADLTYWRGQPEDPLLTAIGVLLRNHPTIEPFALPLTRRLPPSAVPVVQPAFYPGLEFRAASLPDDRGFELTRAGRSRDSATTVVDKVLDTCVSSGWAHVELPDVAVLLSDPEAAETIVSIVTRLLERSPKIRDEREPEWHPLAAGRIAVAVSHNDQKDLLRMLLQASGLSEVRVDTANRLQGLEYEVTVVWHPLAGLPDLDEFHLDPGRLCVMTTRHRQGCIIVGRAGDREHVRRQPPTTPAYLGWDPDPVLDGWEAHRHVFEALEGSIVAA